MNIKHKPKKSRMMLAAAFLVGVLAVGGAALAYADTSTTKTDPMSTLVTTLAQKFNLNPSDVKAVVDQVMTDEQTARQAAHTQTQATRLAQAVTAGTITQAQADLITAKEAELKSTMIDLSGKTPAERQAYFQTQQASLQQWATDNKIPMQFMHMGFGRGHMHGPRLTPTK